MYSNIKITIRNLRRNGVYSAINILGLAVSLAAVIIITLWVDNELTFNRWYTNSENLYITCSNDGFKGISLPLINTLQSEFPEVKHVSNFTNTDNVTLYSWEDGMNGYNESGAYVDEPIFEMLDINLLHGSVQSVFQSPFSIVLSESMAKKIFGKDDPVGKTLRVDNYTESYQVTGVFREQPKNSSFRFQWLMPFEVLTKREGWDPVNGWNSFRCCVELHSKTDIAVLNDKIKDAENRRTGRNSDTFLYPISQFHLYGEFVDGKPVAGKRVREMKELSFIAFVIMLIACINFINLSTARAHKRMIEIGVRKVFGAKRRKLIWQLLSESAILIASSLLLALLAIRIVLPVFNQLWNTDLPVHFWNFRHLTGILLVGVICTVLSGLYPAFYISAFNAVDMMKKLKNRASNTSEWIRKGLVIFQFAASFVLICMTIAIVLQIRHGQHRPLGYTKNHLLRVSGVSGITPQSLIRDELAKSALVEGTAFANDALVLIGSQSNAFQWHRKSDEIDPYIHRSYVSHDYIATIGFKLLEGRTFYEESEMESRNVIINKTLADMMGDEGRINSELWQGNRERAIIYTVVGIIDDYICDDIYRSKSEPLILHYDNGRPGGFLYIRLNSQADIGKAFIMVQRTLSQFSTDRPLDYDFVDDLVNRMFDVQRQNGFLVAFFSVLSIFISCLGLFGLVTYVAESKIKELGIRKILGASVGSLVGMLVKDFLILVTISAFVATPLAYYWIDKMLQDYEYRITIGLGLFALAMLITILLTIFTVGWQAGKAATANPVNALKVE